MTAHPVILTTKQRLGRGFSRSKYTNLPLYCIGEILMQDRRLDMIVELRRISGPRDRVIVGLPVLRDTRDVQPGRGVPGQTVPASGILGRKSVLMNELLERQYTCQR